MVRKTNEQQQQSLLIRPGKWELKLFGWTIFSRYYNPWDFKLPSPLAFVMFLLSSRYRHRPAVPDAAELDRQLPVMTRRPPRFCDPAGPNQSVTVTWLGHAGCLFAFRGGVRVLCDPVFSQRASPLQWLGPRRHRPSPCQVADLPELAAVCISHNHFDHMDLGTLAGLAHCQPGLHFYVPMGDGWWVKRYCGVPLSQIHELEWWDSVVIPETPLEVVFTPASHWSGRSMLDKNRSLWGSFVLRSGDSTAYFAGDTGYEASIFKRIGQTYGPMTISAIPIGAYEPRDVFCAQHVSPNEAVKIHSDVGSQKSVGIHWGTFCLSTTEGLLQPPDDLRKAVAKASLTADSFVTVCPGASVTV